MKTLTSEQRFYSCICQKNLINSTNLKKHLLLPSSHKLYQASSKQTSKQLSPDLNNLKALNYSKNYTFKDLFRITSLIQMKFSIPFKYFSALASFLFNYNPYPGLIKLLNIDKILPLSISSLKQIMQIFSLIKQLYIKQITQFKHLKSECKSGFRYFLKRTTSEIRYFVITQNEKYLVSGSNDGIIRIWDLASLNNLKNLRFHQAKIISMDVDRDSRFVLSYGSDNLICFWNLTTLRLEKSFHGPNYSIYCIKFCGTSKYFITASDDKIIAIWDMLNQNFILKMNLGFKVYSFGFMNMKKLILAVCGKYTIKKIDLMKNKVLKSFQTHENIFCSLIIKKFGLMVTGNFDGSIYVVGFKSFNMTKCIDGHTKIIYSIDYCNDRELVVTGSEDAKMKLWEITRFVCINKLDFGNEVFSCVRFAIDRLFFSTTDSKIHMADIDANSVIKSTSRKGFFSSSIAFSCKLGLIAYGNELLNVYSLKSKSDICMRTFHIPMVYITFVKSFILCGNLNGQIIFLNPFDLKILKQYFIDVDQIFFATSTKDFKKLAYSTQFKSNILDFETNKVLLNVEFQINTGKFFEKMKTFVFIDSDCTIHILKDYVKLIKIPHNFRDGCFHLYKVHKRNKAIIKLIQSDFILVNLDRPYSFEMVENKFRIRDFDKSFRFYKQDIIFSCLYYTESI